ncbi:MULTISPECIES: choline/ethanolamine kinase family protein [Gemella]|uniref:choline/ethanolamine kinase family protein n=1 Tax=Gemella TaxID=1378 RepID=UPI000767FA13|nr:MULTISPECIES: phosphotransferase family protein [Gemella]AME08900.1 choline kinase [Gemella sp. oral taxon 928]AXI26472.1 choline kinase [Gemella sp. ND 6198]
MKELIRDKISILLSPEEEIINVERLGGMTNNNYLVETTDKKYIVKFFGKGTEKLIDRKAEKYNLELLQDLELDVKNYVFDIEAGIKVNKYIENAKTFDKNYIKTKLPSVAEILKTVHSSKKELKGEFNPFSEILKYESLIIGKIYFPYYNKIREKVMSLKKPLEELGIQKKSCHIDLVPENFIEDEKGHIYLIDWEYSTMNDPMWDLAALFLESDFEKSEEGDFLRYYNSEKTPVSVGKILIYKILQDFIWSLWTIYKEEQGADFGTYGKDRYQRALKNLKEYVNSYEK